MSTVNVNLAPCIRTIACYGDAHIATCPGAPILIPCPFPEAVFDVALGECLCFRQNVVGARHIHAHADDCPARPVKVACSISGKTWEESEVEDVEWPPLAHATPEQWFAARERWALVKALMLGTHGIIGVDPSARWRDLEHQRDAVFSALVDMTLAEEAHDAATRAFVAVVPGAITWGSTINTGPRHAPLQMARYVEHLVEQVGVLHG